LALGENALGQLHLPVIPLQQLQHLPKETHMFVKGPTVNQNIIKEN
jgi:hypothetical protein